MILPHDRQVAAWLVDDAHEARPDALARALDATHRTRKRPRWTFPERWLPMQLMTSREAVPRAFLILMSLALLIAALGVAILVVGSQRTPDFTADENGVIAYSSAGKLYLSNPLGGPPRPLPQAGEFAFSPAFSPDGSRLAYLAKTSLEEVHVFVANADGSEPVQVSVVPFDDAGDAMFPPAWAPDGTHLVHFARDDGVWVMAADGSTQRRVAEGWSVAWSPDGNWIAFGVHDRQDAELRAIRPDGTGLRTLATADFNSSAFHSIGWTPDGSAILFHRDGQGVFSVDLEGAEEQLAEIGQYPTVSPDGRYVAFLVQEGSDLVAEESVGLLEVATGATSRLGPGGCLVEWAPDSSTLITNQRACGGGLRLIPIADPSAAVMLDGTEDATFPDWQAIRPFASLFDRD